MVIYKPCTNDLGDIITLTLKIKEDIEFQKVIIVKLKPRKFSSLKTEWIAQFEPLKQILYDLPNFCIFAHL
jgi:hypothetical protein